MTNKMIKKRIHCNKKGFTLVELIVAMMLMALISTSLSTILSSTFKLYTNAEMTSLLYNVNQKLHIALNDELSSCKTMLLFVDGTSNAPTNAYVKDEYQARLYLNSNGYIMKHTIDGDSHILLSEKSYRGAKVVSLIIKYDSVSDRFDYNESSWNTTCYRVLYVTTVLQKNGVKYENTSTVRLYNMALWATQIQIKRSYGSIVDANSSSKNYEFTGAVYYYTQYYSVTE